MTSDPFNALQRKSRIVDMMLSMHARLRDIYARRVLVLEATQLGLSALLGTTTFIDPAIVRHLGFDPANLQVATGTIATLLFVLSVIALRVNWAGSAEKHGRAATILSEIQHRLEHRLRSTDPSSVAVLHGALRAASRDLNTLPPIPERYFHPLKAYHVRKVAISELVSQHPGTPLIVLKTRMLLGKMQPARSIKP